MKEAVNFCIDTEATKEYNRQINSIGDSHCNVQSVHSRNYSPSQQPKERHNSDHRQFFSKTWSFLSYNHNPRSMPWKQLCRNCPQVYRFWECPTYKVKCKHVLNFNHFPHSSLKCSSINNKIPVFQSQSSDFNEYKKEFTLLNKIIFNVVMRTILWIFYSWMVSNATSQVIMIKNQGQLGPSQSITF